MTLLVVKNNVHIVVRRVEKLTAEYHSKNLKTTNVTSKVSESPKKVLFCMNFKFLGIFFAFFSDDLKWIVL